MYYVLGCTDDSVGKVFAIWSWRSEFKSPDPVLIQVLGYTSVIPLLLWWDSRQRQENPPNLMDQLACKRRGEQQIVSVQTKWTAWTSIQSCTLTATLALRVCTHSHSHMPQTRTHKSVLHRERFHILPLLVSLYMCNIFGLECHPKVDVFVETFNKIYLKKAKPLQRGGEGVPLEETLGPRSFSLFLPVSVSSPPYWLLWSKQASFDSS